MALTLTPLNNNAAAANTFVFLGGDRQSSEWLNTTAADPVCNLVVKSSIAGKNTTTGSAIRRFLLQGKMTKTTTTVSESATINVSCVAPVTLSTLTETNLQDLRAFIVNALTSGNWTALRRGEV